jgi:hypothetical protein
VGLGRLPPSKGTDCIWVMSAMLLVLRCWGEREALQRPCKGPAGSLHKYCCATVLTLMFMPRAGHLIETSKHKELI